MRKSYIKQTGFKKRKSDSLSKHKAKAWHEFSLFIRYRDAIETTNGIKWCACVTCNRLYPTTGVGCIQAGHFISGRHNAVLFSETGVHGQCYGCNTGKNGSHVEYFIFMEKKYGRSYVDHLIAESKKSVKYSASDYDLIAETYRQKTEDLLKSIHKQGT